MRKAHISARRLGAVACLLGAMVTGAVWPTTAAAQGTEAGPGCTPMSLGGGIPVAGEDRTYTGTWGTNIPYRVYHNLCYGDAEYWEEWVKQSDWGGNHRKLRQRFDLYLPQKAQTSAVPLVIYAHPNGQTEDLVATDARFDVLVGQALAAGFAVASIEFRHPVASFVDPLSVPAGGHPSATQGPIAGDDVSTAVRFMRYMAGDLRVKPANIFLAGQSRGTLGLMNALSNPQPLGTEGWRSQSSAVRAVVAYQAQTTYRESEVATTFIKAQDALGKPRRLWFEQDYPDVWGDPGSAAALAADPNTTLVPLRLTYDRTVTLKNGLIALQCYVSNNPNREAQGFTPYHPPACLPGEPLFDIHDPNYGYLLYTKYQQRSATHLVTLCTNVGDGNVRAGFAFYIEFFKNHLLHADGGTDPGCP